MISDFYLINMPTDRQDVLKQRDFSQLTSNSSGNSSVEGSYGRGGDILWRVFRRARLTSSHHVGLQQSPLQINIVVGQCLVLEGQHLQDLQHNKCVTKLNKHDKPPITYLKCSKLSVYLNIVTCCVPVQWLSGQMQGRGRRREELPVRRWERGRSKTDGCKKCNACQNNITYWLGTN